jgi:hypothetical protein
MFKRTLKMKLSAKVQAAVTLLGGKCARGFKLAVMLATIAALSMTPVAFAASGKGGGTPVPPPPPPVTTTTTTAVVPTSPLLPATMFVGDAPVTVNFALINTGTIPLAITSIVMQEPFLAPGTSVSTLNKGSCIDVCTFSVTFNPAVAGFMGALVNFTFGNAPFANAGTGNTQVLVPQPVLSVTASGGLSSIPVNSVTAGIAEMVTLQNTGGQPLTINSATFSGANPGDFVFLPIPQNPRSPSNITSCTLLGAFPISLGFFQRCGYRIGFTPTAEGPRSATFTVTTNDPAQPTVSFDVAGNALAPTFQPVLSAFNVTGLWTNPAETDWSLTIAHHQRISNIVPASTASDAVIATFATFDANGVPTWFTIRNGSWTGTPANVVTFSTTFTGEVHQLTGTYFADPFNAARVADSVVGTATLSFTDASNGTLSFTINGVSGQKSIAAAAF